MKKVMLVLVLVVFSLPLFAAGQSEGEEPYIHDNSFGFSFLTGFSFSDGSNDFQNTLGINAFYHPVRFLAIEAGFNFSVTSEDKERQGTASFATGETNYSSYGGKLGLFAFIHLGRNFYLYIGPRAGYQYSYNETNYDPNPWYSDSNNKEFAWGLSAVVGFKVLITEHLGFFSDFNFGYTHTKSVEEDYNTSGVLVSRSKDEGDRFNVMSAMAGICFYF